MKRILHFNLILCLSMIWCTTLFAQLPPVNDLCSNAITLTASGMYDFTTEFAGTDGPNHPDDCPSSGSTPEVLYKDVWYVFEADFTGEAIFSTCSTANFDTKIAVYAPGSACPPLNEDIIACNEDGPSCTVSTSLTIFDVTAGESYLLRLGGYGDGEPGEEGSGTFIIEEYIAPDGPENDNCENAIELILDENEYIQVEFSTIGATTDGPLHEPQSCFEEGEKFVYNNIWYTYTATFTGYVEFSNCGTSSFDSRVAVYGPNQSCPPTTESLVGCGDDDIDENGMNCGGFTSIAGFPVEIGQSYLISFGGWSASNSGTGTFTLKRIDPPVPPANDNCANADSVYVISEETADNFDIIFEGFNLNSTFEDGVVNPVCNNDGEFRDVWYKFNTGNNTELQLRFNIITAQAQFMIDLWNTCQQIDTTDTYFCIKTDELGNTYSETTLSNFSGEPTDYVMRVTTRITGDAPGEFWFQLVGEPYVQSGLAELNLNDFSFFPNPAHHQVNARFHLAQASEGNVEILNMLGQVVQQKDFGRLAIGQQELNMSLDNLESGIYFFRLQMKEGQKTVKFVVE